MLNKKKKLAVFLTVVLLIGCVIAVAYLKFSSKNNSGEKVLEGIVIDVKENSIFFQDILGEEYVVSFAEGYVGEQVSELSAKDHIKIWFLGDIAETYPMQIIANKIEKIK